MSFFINSENQRKLIICLTLITVTTAVYWQVKNHDFINYDDHWYVTENSQVQAGLTMKGTKWAFTTSYGTYWHPLTWLSHMLDVQLFGMRPGWHHLMNLFFHVMNTFLLFLVLHRMSKALWQSAFVAALFALHPLHVESVAWIAERKDVLSAFFWMLTMGAYAFYAEKPGILRYLLVLLLFALGLMSKPMLVTLPFVLLLLDYWPLERFYLQKQRMISGAEGAKPKEWRHKKRKTKEARRRGIIGAEKPETEKIHWSLLRPLITEKIPLFALSAASSVITLVNQQAVGAMSSLQGLPLLSRIANSLIAYVCYLGKMIWPANLAIIYPHPVMVPPWQVLGASALLTVITFIVIWTTKRLPYLTVGWFWYIGTLIPVIGLVQVGMQSMADRFTYIPLIGLLFIVAWGIPDALKKTHYRHWITGIAALLVIAVLSVCTWKQLQLWQNDLILFEHTLKHTRNNPVAERYLGIAFSRQGKLDIAMRHLTRAIEIYPHDEEVHLIMGNLYTSLDKKEEAIAHYKEAIRINPNFARAYFNIGNVYASQRKTGEALASFSKAIQIDPQDAEAHYNMGTVFFSQGKYDEAISHFREAIRIRPDYAKAHNNLGSALLSRGNSEEAITHFQEALWIQPDFTIAQDNLKNAIRFKSKRR
jgi:Tfp pilus assembly protein PilF